MRYKHPRVQQNSRHEQSFIKRHNKRRTNRGLRRTARLDPANAPRKPRYYDFSQ